MRVRYTCKYCNETNEITSFWKWLRTPHFGTRKRLRCKTCNKVSYMRRQDGRRILDWPVEKNLNASLAQLNSSNALLKRRSLV